MRPICFVLFTLAASAANYPAPTESDFVIHNFRFKSGETLDELKLHYTTLGTLRGDNAVLVLHGTGGSGKGFLSDQFAGLLFGPDQLLDATRFYIILPDGIGHGKSSKPSDGLNERFPHYDYDDMVTAQYKLVSEGLGVKHLRLVTGTSTWLSTVQPHSRTRLCNLTHVADSIPREQEDSPKRRRAPHVHSRSSADRTNHTCALHLRALRGVKTGFSL